MEIKNVTATIFSQKFRQINVLLKNFTMNLTKELHGSELLVFSAKISSNQRFDSVEK